VLIPCKDEAHNISDCVESVAALADEILVADSGSTDGTLEILSELRLRHPSLRIIQREYINPSDFKNWALPQSSHSWILALDADERVTETLAKEIKTTLSQHPPFDAYRIPRNNIFLGKKIRFCGWQNDAPFRLFHRDKCRYDNRCVHEHLIVAPQKAAKMHEAILHNTCKSLEEMLAKSIRYGSLAAEDLDQSGKYSGAIQFVVRPCFRFFRHYIWKQGFRDGAMGLLLACLAAQGAFIKYAFLWARRREQLMAKPSLQPGINTDYINAESFKQTASAFELRGHSSKHTTVQGARDVGSQTEPRPLTMPGIHRKVQEVLDQLPRGSMLDVGAGEGALSKWAIEKGFAVSATDIDKQNFHISGIPFIETDLGNRWPFADNTFDVVVSVEVLEHVENHYHFLSECCRICKPTGRIVLSTPNCHSIESRLNILFSGFDDCAPRPIDYDAASPEKIYMEHIHPVPLPTIELGLRRCGFEIEDLNFNRQRRLSSALLPFLYPLFWWQTYRRLVLGEKSTQSRDRNRKLMPLFLDRQLLTGRISIFTCRQIQKDTPSGNVNLKEWRRSA